VDILALPLAGGPVITVVQTPFDEMAGQFSPNARWIAYQSNSSGRMEIYLRAFGGSTMSHQVSTAGGSQPRWRRDGAELYYIGGDGRLMAINIREDRPNGEIAPDLPVPLFDAHIASGANIPPAVGTKAQYDVAPDGRFLINTAVDSATPPVRVLLDWRTSLPK
jgi:eukaryotic-like serine/threonine-protein kinase